VKSSLIRTASILFLISAVIASANQLTSKALPITPQEPSQLGVFFRVDPATGALSGVEVVKKLGIKKGKAESFGRFLYTTYIEGAAASPIRFSSGETQTFVVRWTGRTPDALKSQVRLMLLTEQDGKRFLTKTYIPVDVQTYGELVYGLNPHRKELGALSFKVTPLARLAPGEYALGESFSGEDFGGPCAFGIDPSGPPGSAK
jgi:hypothetical protein